MEAQEHFFLFSYDTRLNPSIFWGIVGGFIFATLVCVIILVFTKNLKAIWNLFLLDYVTVILLITVVLRESIGSPIIKLNPLHAYKSYIEGDSFDEIGLNLVMFIPIGFLISVVARKNKITTSLLGGVGFSLLIEMLQYYLTKGVTDTGDVLNNTIGTIVGMMSYRAVKRLKMYLYSLLANR